ncbi:MAG: immunity protein YezG family protein [Dehalococcoidia bacterium]
MADTGEQLIQRVAQLAADCAPVDWSRIWIRAEVGEGSQESTYDFESPSATRNWYEPPTPVQYEVNMSLLALQRLMSESGKEPWNIAYLALERDGKFSLKFEYAPTTAA